MSYFDCRGVFGDDKAAKQAVENLKNDPVIESELFCSKNIINTAVWDISSDTEFDDDAMVARLVRERMDYAIRLCDAMMQKGALLCIISGHEDNYCSTLGADEPDEILSSTLTASNWAGFSNLINDEFSGWLLCIAPDIASKQMGSKSSVRLVSQNHTKEELEGFLEMASGLIQGRSPTTEYTDKERYRLEYTWRYSNLPQTLTEALVMQGYSSMEGEEEYIIFTKKDNLPILWR